MMKPSEERGQFTNPKVIFLYLDCTSGSPGELLKLHMPELYPIAITAESQGLESSHYYNFRLPLGPLYSKTENGWFEDVYQSTCGLFKPLKKHTLTLVITHPSTAVYLSRLVLKLLRVCADN